MPRVPKHGFSVWAVRGRVAVALRRGLSTLETARTCARSIARQRGEGLFGLRIRDDVGGQEWTFEGDLPVPVTRLCCVSGVRMARRAGEPATPDARRESGQNGR